MSAPGPPEPTATAWGAGWAPPTEADVAALGAAGSLPRAWAARWRADPDRVVLLDPDGTTLTAGALDRASAAAARRLAALGATAGDRVLVSCGANLGTVVAHVGALRLGAVVVPANTAYQHDELAHVLADAGPVAAVVDDPGRADLVRTAGPGTVVATVADLLGPGTGTGSHGGDGPEVALDVAPPDAPAVLAYTSGTTGRPKGAVLSHANLLASADSVRRAWRWGPDDRLLLALPLFHAHGLAVGLHGTLLAGASAVVYARFGAEAVLDGIDTFGATLFFGVPTMYARLVEAPGAERLARLRLCVAGSAPLAPDLFARVEELSGQRVLERYGMSETLMLVSNPYDGERRPGAVGVPLPGVEVRLAEGRTGEVEVRGPSVMSGYWRNPAATEAAFTPDGWFRTGDVGEVDDGYLRLVGRSKELIITGGYNVYPREVEDVLDRHPDVAEVAVAGTPSAEWGEVVTAYVVPRPGCALPQADLEALAAAHLAAYKRPRAYHAVDGLPRNALGKVVRARLAPG